MALNGFDGNGNFLRTFPEGGWKGDATAGIKIRADRHDDHDQALANALSNMICKDGQTTVLADIPFNGHKITGLGTPTAPTDAVNKAYADSVNTFATGANISGADLNGRLTFSSPTGTNGIAWTGADLSWLARLATASPATINRLVLNDKADGTGTDVIEAREDGSLKLAAHLEFDGWLQSTGNIVIGSVASGGNMHFRPYGGASGTSEMYLTTDGVLTLTSGGFQSAGGIYSSTSGSMYFRPYGWNNATAQATIDGSGNFGAAGNITAGSSISAIAGGMTMGAGGAGRIIQIAPGHYFDWDGGALMYRGAHGNPMFTFTGGGSYLTSGNGNLTISGSVAVKSVAGQWVAPSDIRLKDVKGSYDHGLAEVLQVSPVRYSYKTDPDQEIIGLIAQDIEGIFPEMVTLTEGEIDGQQVTDLRQYDPSAFTYALINAVKELSAKLDEANARIEALEAA